MNLILYYQFNFALRTVFLYYRHSLSCKINDPILGKLYDINSILYSKPSFYRKKRSSEYTHAQRKGMEEGIVNRQGTPSVTRKRDDTNDNSNKENLENREAKYRVSNEEINNMLPFDLPLDAPKPNVVGTLLESLRIGMTSDDETLRMVFRFFLDYIPLPVPENASGDTKSRAWKKLYGDLTVPKLVHQITMVLSKNTELMEEIMLKKLPENIEKVAAQNMTMLELLSIAPVDSVYMGTALTRSMYSLYAMFHMFANFTGMSGGVIRKPIAPPKPTEPTEPFHRDYGGSHYSCYMELVLSLMIRNRKTKVRVYAVVPSANSEGKTVLLQHELYVQLDSIAPEGNPDNMVEVDTSVLPDKPLPIPTIDNHSFMPSPIFPPHSTTNNNNNNNDSANKITETGTVGDDLSRVLNEYHSIWNKTMIQREARSQNSVKGDKISLNIIRLGKRWKYSMLEHIHFGSWEIFVMGLLNFLVSGKAHLNREIHKTKLLNEKKGPNGENQPLTSIWYDPYNETKSMLLEHELSTYVAGYTLEKVCNLTANHRRFPFVGSQTLDLSEKGIKRLQSKVRAVDTSKHLYLFLGACATVERRNINSYEDLLIEHLGRVADHSSTFQISVGWNTIQKEIATEKGLRDPKYEVLPVYNRVMIDANDAVRGSGKKEVTQSTSESLKTVTEEHLSIVGMTLAVESDIIAVGSGLPTESIARVMYGQVDPSTVIGYQKMFTIDPLIIATTSEALGLSITLADPNKCMYLHSIKNR
jgi:hypothetical protein